jgi:hypothetical protein
MSIKRSDQYCDQYCNAAGDSKPPTHHNAPIDIDLALNSALFDRVAELVNYLIYIAHFSPNFRDWTGQCWRSLILTLPLFPSNRSWVRNMLEIRSLLEIRMPRQQLKQMLSYSGKMKRFSRVVGCVVDGSPKRGNYGWNFELSQVLSLLHGRLAQRQSIGLTHRGP